MDGIVTIGKRARKKEANRDAILAAAQEVFADLSYGGSTVRDIIGRTGLASGTFYNYFRSKEEVFGALIDEMADELRYRLQCLREAQPDCLTLARRSYEIYFRCILEHRALYLVLRRNLGSVRVLVETPGMAAGFVGLQDDIEAAVTRGNLSPEDGRRIRAAIVGVAVEVGDRLLLEKEPDIQGAAHFSANFVIGGIMMLHKISQPAAAAV